MKVVLLVDVKGTGKKNDIVDVPNGFANNCLIPQKKAIFADSMQINQSKQLANAQSFHKKEELDEAIELGKKLKDMTLNFNLKFGENGKAFGSITTKEIAEELNKLGFQIDKKKIEIKDAIKSCGKFNCTCKLHPKVSVNINIVVEGNA